ncbi:MAG TPA: geranylgeranyl reductase family protein [Egibacteraceae bacterium]|nr:geranylgeranyl reductase family protein [Egibacteraceae bacterium]
MRETVTAEQVYDLVVVGAGPAGAAAALAARASRPDARVLLVDKAEFPRDKSCGDAVSAHAGDELRRLGVATLLEDWPAIDRLRLRSPGGRAAARRCQRVNWVMPRRVFDARLVEAAVARGVERRTQRVHTLEQRPGMVVLDGETAARVVVGADGSGSTVRRLLGVAPNPRDHLAVAVRAYSPAPAGRPEQLIAMVGEGWPSYAWSFPVGDGTANVGYGLLRAHFDGGKAQLHGRLAAALPDADPDPATLRAHHLPFSSRRPEPAAGRVLLAGDAASLVNPLSGEGIFSALVSGRLAGRCAVEDPDAAGRRYPRLLHDTLGSHLAHVRVFARVIRHRPFVEAAVAAASADRLVFDRMVDLTLGAGLVSPVALLRVLRAYPGPLLWGSATHGRLAEDR